MRSESEKSFDECQIRRARLKSLGMAYLSPQNKSLAQSFRYMRNKPTIIAFKTPSLENCEARSSSSSLGSVGKSKTYVIISQVIMRLLRTSVQWLQYNFQSGAISRGRKNQDIC